MQFNKLIDKLVGGHSLSPQEMQGVMETLMRGEMDAVQAGASAGCVARQRRVGRGADDCRPNDA